MMANALRDITESQSLLGQQTGQERQLFPKARYNLGL
jgi:hypothetical protein